MVKFFGGNGQVFISKKQKDLAVKSIPFVLKSYGKMSLLDNQYELPWLESRYAIRAVIFKKKYCYLREFTVESSLIFTINPSNFTLF